MHTMFVAERRTSKPKDYFVAAMFNASPCKEPVLLLKFHQKNTDSDEPVLWNENYLHQMLSHPKEKKDQLQNAFVIENDIIMVVSKTGVHYLSPDLQKLKYYTIDSLINQYMQHINCATMDINEGFLLSCVLHSEVDPTLYGTGFLGQNRAGTCISIVRSVTDSQDPSAPRMVCEDLKQNSCIL